MIAASLSVEIATKGLVIAGVMSCANVFMEVSRKKAVAGRLLLPVLFWSHLFDVLVFAAVFVVQRIHHVGRQIHDSGDLFGIAGVHLSPLATYLIYLLIDLLILALANWFFFRALQISPLSTSVPFLAFTSVFIVPMAFLILREMPSAAKLLGVILTVVGSLVMHRKQFAAGWLAPGKAIFHEKGSRYILAVALLVACTSPLDKRLVLMTDIYTQGLVYGFGMCLFFLILTLSRGEPLLHVLKTGLLWIALAGILDATSLLLQFESYHFVDVVIAISIKRAGIVLSVLFGWLFFHERDIIDKTIASSVMFVGVVMLYVQITAVTAATTTLLTLAAMLILLGITRRSGSARDTASRGPG